MAAESVRNELSYLKHDPQWGVEKLPPVPECAFYDLTRQTVEKNGSKTALISLGKPLTYAEMHALSGRMANALKAMGVKKGDRVGVLLPNCAQSVIAFHGIIRAGAISVPSNVMFKAEELAYVFKDAGVETVICVDLLYPVVEGLKEQTSIRDIISVHIKDISGPNAWIPPLLALDKAETPNAVDMMKLLDQHDPDVSDPGIDPEKDPALIIYTAGTTGFPKGVIETHANMVYSCLVHAHLFGMGRDDVNLQILPMFHIGGYFLCLHALLYQGGTCVMVPSFDAGEFLKMIPQYGATTLVAPPTLYVGLLEHPDFGKYDFSGFKFLIAAGAPVPDALQERWKKTTGVELSKGWGMTETNAGMIVNLPNRRNLSSIGVPLSGELKIVDSDGNTLPRGETGEILVKSRQVTPGYWNKPDETKKAFDKDGFFRTGDAGYMSDDGFVFFVERIKDLIIASGYNIAPTDVEAVIMQHPQVAECAVIGVPDEYRGETVKAFVVLQAGADGQVTADDIIAFCRDRMAAYKVPRLVDFTADLPKSSIGKVLRRELRKQELSN